MANRPMSPGEPTRKHPILPNAHPYAIKTTSSALLSRSNSSPHSAHHARHHYIPSPPSRVQTGMRARHRHSSSVSSSEGEVCAASTVRTTPVPLPTPPQNVVVASSCDPPMSQHRADEVELSRPIHRAETTPSSTTESIDDYVPKPGFSHDQLQDSTPDICAGLPANPKQWNTNELTIYLETSFKSDKATSEDDTGFEVILDYVHTCGLTGRELLRLTDADLAGTLLSDVQRAQLLKHLRTLRANLRGRIYVDCYHSHEVSDDSQQIYSRSARFSAPSQSVRGASMSVDDLRLLLDSNTGEGEATFPLSPVVSLHRSNSVSDASAQRYRDLARMRMRRRGRVKGLIKTWERASTSGSECSTSDTESESDADPKFESNSNTKSPSEPSIDRPSGLQDEPSLDVRSPGSTVLHREPPLSTPPPPYTHTHSSLGVTEAEEEEPSIEELLASSSDMPLRGARAWEADFGLGETVKHVPVSASTNADRPVPRVTEPDPSRHPRGDTQRSKNGSLRLKVSGKQGSTGSRGKDASLKSRRRVVTAIFTGSLSDDVSDNAGDLDRRHTSSWNIVCGKASASPELQDDPESALRALEESVAATRTQLEAFRLRLEKVEADTARQEALSMRTQCSDSYHSFDHELKHRRPEANERATPESVEPVQKDSITEGSSDKDLLGGWKSMTLADVARTVVAKTVGWLFPFGHLGVRDESRARTASPPELNDSGRSPEKGKERLPVARMSCNIILVSFAVCAAVLRRVGFGRWARNQ